MGVVALLGRGWDTRRLRVVLSVVAVVVSVTLFLGCGSGHTSSLICTPRWRVLLVSNPTNFRPGDQSGADMLVVTATNVGCGATNGSPVTLGDVLPAGLEAVEVFGDNPYHDPIGELRKEPEFSGPPYGLICALSGGVPSCVTSEAVGPGDTLAMTVRVHVSTTVEGSSEADEASVSGGGATGVSASNTVTVSSTPAAFGVAKGGVLAAASSYQAGGHPNVTGEFFLNTKNAPSSVIGGPDNEKNCGAFCTVSDIEPVAPPKDVSFVLPAGLVGSVVGVARCQLAEVVNSANCPRDSMVGVATVFARALEERYILTVPVYNIAPNPGEPAAFAFNGLFFPGRIDTALVRNGAAGGYSVRATVSDITGGGAVYGASVTLWGDPAEHDGPGPDAAARTPKGNQFLDPEYGGPAQLTFGGPGVEQVGSGPTFEDVLQARVPLLTGGTQCSVSLSTTVESDSYEDPGVFSRETVGSGVGTGCGVLPFAPSLSVGSDSARAGEPAGYTLDLGVPQSVEAEGLGSANIRDVTATLPAGAVISPSAAVGLGSCSDEQFAVGVEAPAGCPGDSRIGVVRVRTPDLEEELHGEVFLGAPECDPCSSADASEGRLVRLFMQVRGKGEDAILVKLQGTGTIDQGSGQVTASFDEDPQVPFSEFELSLTGGERAAVANPRACGTATTSMVVEPWSVPFTADADLASSFNVDEGCFGPQFNPSFLAEATSTVAGGFSPVSVVFGRGDRDGFLGGLRVGLPVGLLGMISRVKLCGEAEANAGSCGAASFVGEASAEAGPGSDPYLVEGGKVFLTGPYRGAPYGLSVVVPAKAGPYTLSGTTGTGLVVVRAAINVDPHTSAVTVTSDPFPTQLDGIPLQIRRVDVTVGGNGAFTFNPTNCTKTAFGGVLTSVEGATAAVGSSFQVSDCGGLGFSPKVSISTGPRASKKDGASLLFKISYPSGAMGSQSWFHEAKFVIPKQLPARLTTIQQACTQVVFEANPANCPPASRIGYAQVHTPVLPGVLKGPVFFVSYGNAKFPDVVVVLQGEGVTVDLTGETLIKNGVTSATFPDTPDVPFESFEVILPTGEFSEFGSYVNAKHPYQLCGSKLTVPTELKAQNGREIKQNTPVQVNGCKIIKKKAKARKAKKAGASSRAKRASAGKEARS